MSTQKMVLDSHYPTKMNKKDGQQRRKKEKGKLKIKAKIEEKAKKVKEVGPCLKLYTYIKHIKLNELHTS